MKILILAMPDTSDWQDHVMRIPNLAIVSLGATLAGHEVRVIDLLMVKKHLKSELDRQLEGFGPGLICLSAMTFQYPTLLRIASYLRRQRPSAFIAVGGYHVTLLHREIAGENQSLPFDFMVRGEGEQTLRELVAALPSGETGHAAIAGLSWRRHDGMWVHNPDRELCDLAELPLPNRDLRQAQGFHVFNLPIDVVETSRGCPLNCNFCSIRKMYGRSFRRFPVARVMRDLADVRRRGARMVFVCDDNITYDVEHFRAVCEAIIAQGYNDVDYSIQASAYGIAKNPELVPLMDKANIRIVSLGLESMDPASIKFMRKATSAQLNSDAIALLRRHNIGVNALFMIGFPDDTEETIRHNFRVLKALKPDTIYCQVLTPYPKTEVRERLLADGLVDNVDDYSKYDGYHCNIRTRHLSRAQLWKIYNLEMGKAMWSLVTRKNLVLNRYFTGFIGCQFKVVLNNWYRLISGQPHEWRPDL